MGRSDARRKAGLAEYQQALRAAERALRWYADPKHWYEDDWGVPSVINPPDYGDPGKKARLALDRVRRLTDA